MIPAYGGGHSGDTGVSLQKCAAVVAIACICTLVTSMIL